MSHKVNRNIRPMPYRPRRLAAVIWLAFATPMFALPLAARAQSAEISDLGALPGGANSEAFGVSSDGSVVVGLSSLAGGFHAFRWTQAGGMQDLGGIDSSANGVSANGSVVVGDSTVGGQTHAFRWTQAGGMQDLGTLGGGGSSFATATSADGSVVVGASVPGGLAVAFRWTQAGGMQSLGYLNGGTVSYAYGVSADGSVVVGVARDGSVGDVNRAYRWTQAGGMVSLGTLGGNTSAAVGVSADGSVVIGSSRDVANTEFAFRWTQAGGMQSLGLLNGRDSSAASGISADGAVVVGQALNGAIGSGFRWTQATGMQTVEDWLRAAGVSVPSDITFNANATNSDGSVVVGLLQSGNAYIARVANSGSGLGSGLVTLADLQASLGANAMGGAMALGANDLLIHGAHSRPLMRCVGEGQNAFWVAGDWGRDDHSARDGDLGLAEAGLGRNLGPVQVNISLGQTWANQRLPLNGSARSDGAYLLAEALAPVSGNLWATLGGYRHWGKADLKRGYLNAGVQDYSTGNPDVETWALRGRLELNHVYNAAGASFSPYADLSYSETTLEGYTEHGGGFAARFDSRKDKATELRLGANFERSLAADTRLVGLLEAAHRFEKNGPHTSGQVLGLFGFDFAGADNKQDWLRAGAGVEARIAGGTGSLMLNATTRGEVASYWLAAGWQKAF